MCSDATGPGGTRCRRLCAAWLRSLVYLSAGNTQQAQLVSEAWCEDLMLPHTVNHPLSHKQIIISSDRGEQSATIGMRPLHRMHGGG